MKTLISDGGDFGPFRIVETLNDRLRCDGVEYQFATIGSYTLVDSENRPPPAPVVPESVPMLNAEEAMRAAGWLTPWLAILAAWEGDEGEAARIKWNRALTVRRDDPLVAAGIAALGKTDEEADALFIAAAELVV
jgi:hypothetical protein